MTSPYRPEFEAALRLFARVSGSMKDGGLPAPILVGGAAVELYTNSQIATGDFDIVTGAQDDFESLLQAAGFVRPRGVGIATRGWIHPELGLGFEVVSASLLDGLAERERVRLIDLDVDGAIAVIAIEDIIADRMGQYASGTAPDMLSQAKALFRLHPNLDLVYLQRRIYEETMGDYGTEALEN